MEDLADAANAGGRRAVENRDAGIGAGDAHHVPLPQDQAGGARSHASAKVVLVVAGRSSEDEMAIDLQTAAGDEEAPASPHHRVSKLKAPANAGSNDEGVDIDLDTAGEEERSNKTPKTKGSTEPVPISPPRPPTLDVMAALRRDDSMDEAKAKEKERKEGSVIKSVHEPSSEDEGDAQPSPRDARGLSSALSSLFAPRQQREDGRAPNHTGVATLGPSDTITADVETASASPYVVNDNDEIIVPEATAVTPEEELPVGTVIRPEKNSLTIAGHKFQLRYVALGSIVVLAAVIALAVTLSMRGGDVVEAPTSAPSLSLIPSSEPSTQPSLGPTAILQADLMEVISSYSGGKVSRSQLGDSQTAHRRALSWLVGDQTNWTLREKDPLSDAELVERFALALLYFESGGDGWSDTFKFLSEEHACKWRGRILRTFSKGVVSCSPDMRVTSLALFNNKLQGSLSSEIGLLEELTSLNIGFNDLKGNISDVLSPSTKVTNLELNNNDLMGSLDSLEGLTNLTVVDLSSNELTGNLSGASNLTKLESFKVAGNKITGTVPESFKDYAALETLHLQGNQLSGTFEFMCNYLPSEYFLDCYGDQPEVKCNCCMGCTVVSDEVCDSGSEKPIEMTIYVGEEGPIFEWELKGTKKGGYGTIAAGGYYDDGERINIQLCLTAPGWYEISTKMDTRLPLADTPIPTFMPTSLPAPTPPTPFPTWTPTNSLSTPTPTTTAAPTTSVSPTSPPQPFPSTAPTATASPTQETRITFTTDGYSATIGPNDHFQGPNQDDDSDDEFEQADPGFAGHPTSSPTLEGCGRLELKLITDAFGMDTSWEIINRNDVSTVASESGFPSNTTLEPFIACLDPFGCYDFVIKDVWDDGICCQQGMGSYNISIDGMLMGSGGAFGAYETVFLGGSCGDSITKGWRPFTPLPTLNPTITALPSTSTKPTVSPSSSLLPSSTALPSGKPSRSALPTSSPLEPTPFPTWPPTMPTLFPIPFSTYASTPQCLGLNLTTDAFGMDTRWEVFEKINGTIVASNSSVASNQTFRFSKCLDWAGCYEFIIRDDWDDGVCCQQGEGSYSGYDVWMNGRLIGGGEKFGSSETVAIGGNCGVDPTYEGTCPENYSLVNVTINTDSYGYETSWEVFDASTGQVYMTNEHALEDDSSMSWIKCVPTKDCYQFTIYDSYGDGGPLWMVELDGEFADAGSGIFAGHDTTIFGVADTECVETSQLGFV